MIEVINPPILDYLIIHRQAVKSAKGTWNSGKCLQELQDQVQELIADGYEPIGNISISESDNSFPFKCAQAMIKYKKEL